MFVVMMWMVMLKVILTTLEPFDCVGDGDDDDDDRIAGHRDSNVRDKNG